MFTRNRLNELVLIITVPLFLSACGGSDSSSGGTSNNPGGENTVMIDATAGGLGAAASDPANKYTYFDMDTGSVVGLTDTQAQSDTVWDIAFKRTKTIVNGGASGPGNVSAVLVNAQDGFYDTSGDPVNNVFINATAATEQSDFEVVTDVSALVFESDENKPRIDGSLSGDDSWALYNPVSHTISAQPDAWNIARSANGRAFAKFHVTNIEQLSRDITLELFFQQQGETAFESSPTMWTASIGAAGGVLCFDFETQLEVDCTTASTDWDLMVEVSASGFEWNIWTNGGIRGDGASGASYGSIQTADFSYIGVGEGDDQFPERFLEPDAPSGVFLQHSWYAYNLQGNNKLWPNYRVYAIDVDGVAYKMQFLSYYDAADNGGNLTIRFEAL